ncbi:MAG: (E)-4-hydroxy-3-methylbut-2-enyl-diphosphate synthase [Chitinophagaceae bacterium]|nr:(E)-4-hydroxy-3-methylbut-2-enyl-diphosphate synthase [Chitinophagaceae bacterium]
MQHYCESLSRYRRLRTRLVNIGGLLLGNPDGDARYPIRIQTMTTTDTMDTRATVEQCIRCIEAGAELVRITAPSKKEAENLLNIKKELRNRGYHTPLVADIHYTPNAAEIAARIVEKVRINPGNYVDKKKFELREYSDAEYAEELEKIREKFIPLVKICKEYGTALRIGTNHGSLSDRIMSRYGDTPLGMVESAMEFLRIARDESFHNIVLSMKSSNPLVMVQAYRLLVKTMYDEFGEIYPLHLGVTEAGDGEDGRIKSAVGIGTLLEDGIGDTIRVSLTEDPEYEIPVCKDLVKRYHARTQHPPSENVSLKLPYSPYDYQRRHTVGVKNIGAKQPPVVIADWRNQGPLTAGRLQSIGYYFDEAADKWTIGDMAADFLLTDHPVDFALPGTLQVILPWEQWKQVDDPKQMYPLIRLEQFSSSLALSPELNVVLMEVTDEEPDNATAEKIKEAALHDTVVFALYSEKENAMQLMRNEIARMMRQGLTNPVIIFSASRWHTPDEHLIHFSAETGGLLLEGMCEGICLRLHETARMENMKITGRTYLPVNDVMQFLNNTAFTILQATRTRISKTEYISCPSCGRTLFDLQETTSRIRAVTNHLKGVKIAIMGCIVNGPGEMADADFGYVGSGPGKITLYKGKDIVKRNINSEVAVEELIQLLKENGVWTEPDHT